MKINILIPLILLSPFITAEASGSVWALKFGMKQEKSALTRSGKLTRNHYLI
jgi:hypothetical protein